MSGEDPQGLMHTRQAHTTTDFVFIFIMCLCRDLAIRVQGPNKAREGIRSPRAGVKGSGCELPNMGFRNKTPVLDKSH